MADKSFDAEHTFLDAVDDFTVLFHSDRVLFGSRSTLSGSALWTL